MVSKMPKSTMLALSRADKMVLTQGQQLSFRLYRMQNLDKSVGSVINRDILMNLPEAKSYDCNKKQIRIIKQKAQENSLQAIILVAIDSSVACKRNIVIDLPKIKKYISKYDLLLTTLNPVNVEVVLLNTVIGHMENLYKLKNRERYSKNHMINWSNLRSLVDLFNKSPNALTIPRPISSVTSVENTQVLPVVLSINLKHMNEVLNFYEDQFDSYSHGIINSINDKAQVKLLKDAADGLLSIVPTIPVMYTNDFGRGTYQDHGMPDECRKMNVKPVFISDILNTN